MKLHSSRDIALSLNQPVLYPILLITGFPFGHGRELPERLQRDPEKPDSFHRQIICLHVYSYKNQYTANMVGIMSALEHIRVDLQQIQDEPIS
jgi:hypothetical protein